LLVWARQEQQHLLVADLDLLELKKPLAPMLFLV
jgi:hypothetical protein